MAPPPGDETVLQPNISVKLVLPLDYGWWGLVEWVQYF